MHAIQQNKTLFSSVNQPINQSTNPVVASITRKQSINHIHSRKRARVDKELSTRIGQRISRLPAPRARPTPPRARESRATYFFTSPHSLARANPRSSDASNARQCAHAVRSATERVRARLVSATIRRSFVATRSSSGRTLVTTARRVEDFVVVAIVVVANVVLDESIAACIARRGVPRAMRRVGEWWRDSLRGHDWWIDMCACTRARSRRARWAYVRTAVVRVVVLWYKMFMRRVRVGRMGGGRGRRRRRRRGRLGRRRLRRVARVDG